MEIKQIEIDEESAEHIILRIIFDVDGKLKQAGVVLRKQYAGKDRPVGELILDLINYLNDYLSS